MTSYNLKINEKIFTEHRKKITISRLFLNFIEENNYKKNTINKYITSLTTYTIVTGKTLEELIEEAKTTKPDKYLEEYEKFLKEKKYSYGNIKTSIGKIKTFYRKNGIEIPKNRKDITQERKEYRKAIEESTYFNKFARQRMIQPSTRKTHITNLTCYCNYCQKTIDELIKEAIEEQEAGIPLNKRTLKERLIEYKPYLVEQQYRNETIKGRMKTIKAFYTHFDIEIPNIPSQKLPHEEELTYEDLPKIEHVKRALESTGNAKHKLAIMINLTTGLASADIRRITRRMYLKATQEYHNETEDIDKAIRIMDGKTDIVPIFRIMRKKSGETFYTCCTPEANQYFINYLKTTDNSNLDEPILNYSDGGFEQIYENINDKLEWGFIGKHRFFTSHKIRKFHATTIGNREIANQLQGRKEDSITETYFKKDPKKIKQDYMKYIEKLSVYEKYKVEYIIDENYKKVQEENKELKEAMKKQKEEFEKRTQELEEELDKSKKEAIERIEILSKELKHTETKDAIDVEIKQSIDLYMLNLKDPQMYIDKEMTKFEKQIMELDPLETLTVREIAYDLAINDTNFEPDNNGMEKAIKKAIFKMKANPDLKLKVKLYREEQDKSIEKIELISQILHEKLIELDMWEDDELEELEKDIISHALENIDKILLKDINQDFIMKLIEKQM